MGESASGIGKKPAARTRTQNSPKSPNTSLGKAKPNTAQKTKPAPKKPAARNKSPKKLTIKNATTPSVVILPPSWKPKRAKTPPLRRIVKPKPGTNGK
jgi:hypothetical protein